MRSLTSGAVAALSAPAVPIVMLVEMMFSTPLRVASSAVPIVWGGYTWLGAGPLGQVDAVKDAAGEAGALQFSISGVPQDSIALVLNESARNKACTVRLAILDAITHAILDVSTIGTFLMDQMVINGGTVAVTAIPMARVFARQKPLRYTDGDQQLISAGDRALEYLNSQAQAQDVWPAASWFRK